MWRDVNGVLVYGNSVEGAEITPFKNGFQVYVFFAELEDEGFAKTAEQAENLAYDLLDQLESKYYEDDEPHEKAREEDWR